MPLSYSCWTRNSSVLVTSSIQTSMTRDDCEMTLALVLLRWGESIYELAKSAMSCNWLKESVILFSWGVFYCQQIPWKDRKPKTNGFFCVVCLWAIHLTWEAHTSVCSCFICSGRCVCPPFLFPLHPGLWWANHNHLSNMEQVTYMDFHIQTENQMNPMKADEENV